MTSTIAMSSVVMTRPGTTRPVLSQLVAAHTSRSHNFWRSARSYHSIRDKMERIARSIDKYQRHPQANLRSKAEACNGWPSTAHRDPNSSKGWATHWPRSRFSELAGREKTYWDAQHEQMNHRIAHLKRQVAKHPYEVIFGGRLVQSSHYINQSNTATAWPGFLRTFLGAEKPMTGHPSKAHLQDFNFTQSPVRSSTSSSRDTLEYDPISGRMAPKAPQPQTGSESTMQSSSAGVDCPPGSEVEAKFASHSSAVEDGQFQPGSVSTATSDTTKSQTVDCAPGSEVEALFSSDPASYKDIQSGAGLPKESAQKPNIHVACPLGSESEALFNCESIRSEGPPSETLKVQAKPKKSSADAGLSSGHTVECAPGGEIEALFTAQPAARNDRSLPPQGFGYQPTANVSVDFPLGSQLEAKFAAQLEKDCNSEKEVAPVECSPDGELEARIVAETTRAQLSDPTVDCAPGSELEALFTTDPAAVEATHYPPTMTTADAYGKKAGITVDCQPGNEPEANYLSDAASAEIRSESEDLTALHASDIRARYTPLKSAHDTFQSRGVKDIEFNTPEEHGGDFLQAQNSSTPTPQWSQADYRILTYDTATSKVTTTSADTFFGTNPLIQPHEILSRLHNPAKFVPYFASMQKDGYELTTGGGDILVFKRSARTNATKSTSAAGQQEHDSVSADVQADIARYQCHDSFDSTAYVRHYNPSSTVKPSASGYESSSHGSSHHSSSSSSSNSSSSPGSSSDLTSSTATAKSKPKSKSTFRKVLRRMILTGTITAGSCYAIGVLTEYFRTGGLDGRGADGFTPFESDRRHRE